ncbi:hypothetical protein AB0V79_27050 [Mesorhizobium ciceri]|uniref:hypothetical protein n=1 Tax=Mesorhizobium ciceri TaxID=39645 RepID=UPI0007A94DF8|nr:hypothetical protein [Mesorhizobium ciceri]AMY00720.1 hypothetical protein A4R29_15365 [Mesorhizobium ciceri biovar biserrulae]
MADKFDLFGELDRGGALALKWGKWGLSVGRHLRVRSARRRAEDLYGRTPGEIMEQLSGWQRSGWRGGISYPRGSRPFETRIVSYTQSETCKTRIGTMDGGPGT